MRFSNKPIPVDDVIHLTAENIVNLYHPAAVILFGSRAYGIPHEDSDIDLLVIGDIPGTPLKRSLKVYREARVSPWPLDVRVLTAVEIAEEIRKGDPYLRKIIQEGRYLYGSREDLGVATVRPGGLGSSTNPAGSALAAPQCMLPLSTGSGESPKGVVRRNRAGTASYPRPGGSAPFASRDASGVRPNRPACESLTNYGVGSRYPVLSIEPEEASEAVTNAQAVLQVVSGILIR